MMDILRRYYDKIVAFLLGVGADFLTDISGVIRSLIGG